VDKTAYASVVGKLSDAGILVAIVNLDPPAAMRIPTPYTGAGPNSVLKIGFEINNLLGIGVDEWILMGHGQGASVVTDIAKTIAQKSQRRKQKVILWSPLTPSTCLDLSKCDASIMAVNGTETLKRKMPPDAVFCNVSGGNHSSFAHYGPSSFPVKDKEADRTKTLDELQKEIKELTVDFILDREPSRNKKD